MLTYTENLERWDALFYKCNFRDNGHVGRMAQTKERDVVGMGGSITKRVRVVGKKILLRKCE